MSDKKKKTAQCGFHINQKLKKDMQSICNEMGLTLQAAYTIFTKKVLSEKKIPFKVETTDDDYSTSEKECIFIFRIEPEIKERMKALCKDMGITLSIAYTFFSKKVVREKQIPFEIEMFNEMKGNEI